MRVIEKIKAYGHENVRSTHKTTFEITKEKRLTKHGDCIIAVGATKGARDLGLKFREVAREETTEITIIIEAGGVQEIVKAMGSPKLLLAHPTDLVVRKSDYICNRTVAIRADRAASNISRELVKKLRNPSQKVMITLTAETT